VQVWIYDNRNIVKLVVDAKPTEIPQKLDQLIRYGFNLLNFQHYNIFRIFSSRYFEERLNAFCLLQEIRYVPDESGQWRDNE